MRRLLPIASAALLGACAAKTPPPEPIIITQEVDRPVAVSCVPPNLDRAPTYPDSDEALRRSTPEGRYSLLIASRDLRKSRLGEVEPVIEECRR